MRHMGSVGRGMLSQVGTVRLHAQHQQRRSNLHTEKFDPIRQRDAQTTDTVVVRESAEFDRMTVEGKGLWRLAGEVGAPKPNRDRHCIHLRGRHEPSLASSSQTRRDYDR